ncbi:hypothetical protein ID144_02805 [Pseudomonas sp. JM0905a]|nr:hypothetical protein [Pseudomonas sp. JM0905a]MBD2835969.1 hypothetical protein [Pseudomonas sp. JM0905a]
MLDLRLKPATFARLKEISVANGVSVAALIARLLDELTQGKQPNDKPETI